MASTSTNGGKSKKRGRTASQRRANRTRVVNERRYNTSPF